MLLGGSQCRAELARTHSKKTSSIVGESLRRPSREPTVNYREANYVLANYLQSEEAMDDAFRRSDLKSRRLWRTGREYKSVRRRIEAYGKSILLDRRTYPNGLGGLPTFDSDHVGQRKYDPILSEEIRVIRETRDGNVETSGRVVVARSRAVETVCTGVA